MEELRKTKVDNSGRLNGGSASPNGSLSTSRLKHLVNGIKKEEDGHGYDVSSFVLK